MIVRVACVLCLLAVASSPLALTPPVDAAKTANPAGAASMVPSLGHHHLRRNRDSRHGLRGRSDRARAAIVGGRQISIGQAPWQVVVEAFIYPSGSKGESLLCGGSILDSTHILTAAHCVFNSVENGLTPASDFFVIAGTSNVTATKAEEPTQQVVGVESIRPHPYYIYAPDSGKVGTDDVAILSLEEPLALESAATPISLVSAGPGPPEGTAVDLTGFGEENPVAEELNGKLYSLDMTLGYSRECGGENDAVLLCASSPSGTPCNGDSGSALTLGSSSTLIGVEDDYTLISGKRCVAGAENAFANVAAPEIQDFLDGSEAPPRAPRGGGAVIFERPINDGSMGCEPGHWSESPTLTYTFQDSSDGQTLQQGTSSTYAVPAAEVGHKILCQVQASNAGGTGVGRTPGLLAITAAPPAQLPPSTSGTMASPAAPTPESGGVSLAGTSIAVQRNGTALVKLDCLRASGCRGKLTLTAKRIVKAKGRKRTRTVTIAIENFSISGEETKAVKVTLNSTGRALLTTDRARLTASLAILQLQPSPPKTETKSVHLVLQESHNKKK